MKYSKMRIVLVAAAACASLGLAGCGSTGSISSLTDSDSAATIADGTAESNAASILTGTESTNILPEIEAQTISVGDSSDSGEAGESDAASSETQSEESVASETDPDESVSDETGSEEDSEAIAEADSIDVAETDEGGVHGEGNTATCTAGSLYVREEPSSEANDIGALHEGDVITILDSENGWYEINYEGSIGWVSSKYFE